MAAHPLGGPGDLGWKQPTWHSSANQTGVQGSILQRPVPTMVPAHRGWGSAPALAVPQLPAALQRAWDHMSLQCRCDAAAKAEHCFPQLSRLQKRDGGRGGPVCTSLKCSGVRWRGFSPTVASVALPPCPGTCCRRDGGVLSCLMRGALGGPPLPHSPPTSAPLPSRPTAP